MKIIDFLRFKYINVIDYLYLERPRHGLFIYINPFNYFFLRASQQILDHSYYRMDGFFVNAFVGRSCRSGVKRIRQSFDMTSLAPMVFNYCVENHLRLFVAGGTDRDIEKFFEIIVINFPGLEIVGFCSGYNEDDYIVDMAVSSRADVVLLGLGNVKQESVGYRIFRSSRVLVFTCGAFISQTARSSEIEYYPSWVNAYNVRWLYRIFKEPHVLQRVVRFYPKFAFVFVFDLLKRKFDEIF